MNVQQINESVNTQILLSEVAVKLANSTEFDSIYKYVGEKIFEITPNSIVLICGFNYKEKYLQINYTYGLSNMLESVSEILGFNILEFKLNISEIPTENLVAYKSQTIVNINEGIYELTNKKINKTICNSVEKFLGVKKVSVMGFTWEDKLYGGLLLIQKDENQINNQLIEAIINQSANTLQRITFHNKLIKNEQLYRTLIDTSPDAISLSDMNGNLLNINQKAIEYFGPQTIEEREEFSKKQRNIIEFIDSSEREKLIENMKKKNAGVNYPATSYKCLRYNGTSFSAEINSSLLKDSSEKPYAMISVIRDVTERNQIENVLHNIIENNPMSIQILDENGFTLNSNSAFLSLFGIVPPSDFSIFRDLENKGLGEYIKLAKSGEIVHFPDLFYNVKDVIPEFQDNPVWIRAILFPLKDNEGISERFVFMHENISERKLAENALYESEEKFRAVSEYSFNSICIINELGKIIWANNAMAIMGGFPIEMIYGADSFTAFIAPESLEFVVSNFMKFVKGEEYEHHYEFYFIRADGEKRLCEKHMSHFKDRNGKLNLVISMMDITENKNAFNLIKLQKENFRLIFENGSSAMAIINPDSIIEMVNDEYCKIGDFVKEEIIGTSWTKQIPPVDLERLKEYQRLRLINPKDAPDKYEFTFYKNSGEIRHALMSVSVLNDKRIIASFVDVTERKNAEDNIKKNEERYRTVFENSGEGIGFVNQNEEFVFANKAAEEIFGVESKGLVGKNLVNFLSKSDYDNIIKQTQNRKKDEKSVYELDIIRHNKEKRNIILTAVSYFDENENFVGSYGVFRDITERKNAEESLAINNMILSKLNNFSIEIANLPFEENLEVFIAKSIKEITGATVALFSEYNSISKTMATKHIELESKLLEKVVSLIGKQATKVQSHVSDEIYNEIINETIGVRKTLYEATFGAISHTVGKAIQTLLNVDRFVGFAYIIDGKLYGTTLLAMKKDKPDLKKEFFENKRLWRL